jgi:hypothetical protein
MYEETSLHGLQLLPVVRRRSLPSLPRREEQAGKEAFPGGAGGAVRCPEQRQDELFGQFRLNVRRVDVTGKRIIE